MSDEKTLVEVHGAMLSAKKKVKMGPTNKFRSILKTLGYPNADVYFKGQRIDSSATLALLGVTPGESVQVELVEEGEEPVGIPNKQAASAVSRGASDVSGSEVSSAAPTITRKQKSLPPQSDTSASEPEPAAQREENQAAPAPPAVPVARTKSMPPPPPSSIPPAALASAKKAAPLPPQSRVAVPPKLPPPASTGVDNRPPSPRAAVSPPPVVPVVVAPVEPSRHLSPTMDQVRSPQRAATSPLMQRHPPVVPSSATQPPMQEQPAATAIPMQQPAAFPQSVVQQQQQPLSVAPHSTAQAPLMAAQPHQHPVAPQQAVDAPPPTAAVQPPPASTPASNQPVQHLTPQVIPPPQQVPPQAQDTFEPIPADPIMQPGGSANVSTNNMSAASRRQPTPDAAPPALQGPPAPRRETPRGHPNMQQMQKVETGIFPSETPPPQMQPVQQPQVQQGPSSYPQQLNQQHQHPSMVAQGPSQPAAALHQPGQAPNSVPTVTTTQPLAATGAAAAPAPSNTSSTASRPQYTVGYGTHLAPQSQATNAVTSTLAADGYFPSTSGGPQRGAAPARRALTHQNNAREVLPNPWPSEIPYSKLFSQQMSSSPPKNRLQESAHSRSHHARGTSASRAYQQQHHHHSTATIEGPSTVVPGSSYVGTPDRSSSLQSQQRHGPLRILVAETGVQTDETGLGFARERSPQTHIPEVDNLKSEVTLLKQELALERANRELLSQQLKQTISTLTAQVQQEQLSAQEDGLVKEHRRMMESLREQRHSSLSSTPLQAGHQPSVGTVPTLGAGGVTPNVASVLSGINSTPNPRVPSAW